MFFENFFIPDKFDLIFEKIYFPENEKSTLIVNKIRKLISIREESLY